MKKILTAGIVILVGVLLLAGYLFPSSLSSLSAMLVNWGVLVLSFALLLGIGHLVWRHLKKLFSAEKGAALSAVTLIAFAFTLISGLILTTQDEFFSELILNVQVPIEASLLALLAVTLFVASLRLIRTQGWTPLSVGFLLSAVVALLIESGIFAFAPQSPAGQILAFLNRLPVAGARGILLGMALGGLLMGLRVLLSIDKPYGEQ